MTLRALPWNPPRNPQTKSTNFCLLWAWPFFPLSFPLLSSSMECLLELSPWKSQTYPFVRTHHQSLLHPLGGALNLSWPLARLLYFRKDPWTFLLDSPSLSSPREWLLSSSLQPPSVPHFPSLKSSVLCTGNILCGSKSLLLWTEMIWKPSNLQNGFLTLPP